MKRFEKFLISVLLALSLILILVSVSISAAIDLPIKNISFLVVGLDDAAQNTDVICIVNYNTEANSVDVLQLPRDTLYKAKKDTVKINSLYHRFAVNSQSPQKSMRDLSSLFQKLLGISFDGFLGVSTDAFVSLIDKIGGVHFELPRDLFLKTQIQDDLPFLASGKNHLNGRESLAVVRYRKSYLTGDLGRLDVQKLFLKGFFDTVFNEVGFKNLGLTLFEIDGIFGDYSAITALLLFSNFKQIASASFYVETFPGKPYLSDYGVSYYIIDRMESKKLLEKVFDKDQIIFDPDEKFLLS